MCSGEKSNPGTSSPRRSVGPELQTLSQRYLPPHPKCFQACKGGWGSPIKSYAVKRQIMLSAERDANKKRADASICGDQGTSAVGKQINKS